MVQLVPDSPENEAACICEGCPSKADDGLRFYCVRGKSPMAIDRALCACSWCPLWSGYGLTGTFYCDASDTQEDAGAGGGEAEEGEE